MNRVDQKMIKNPMCLHVEDFPQSNIDMVKKLDMNKEKLSQKIKKEYELTQLFLQHTRDLHETVLERQSKLGNLLMLE